MERNTTPGRLGEYKPPPWDVVKRMEEEKDETSKPPQPKVIAQREIGPYVVESRPYANICSIKVYQNLPGWRRKTVGVWSGSSGVCEDRVDQVAKAIHEARARAAGAGALPPLEPNKKVIPVAKEKVELRACLTWRGARKPE